MITVVSVELRVEQGARIHTTEVAGAFDAARDASAARAIGAQLGAMIGDSLALRLQAGEAGQGRAA